MWDSGFGLHSLGYKIHERHKDTKPFGAGRGHQCAATGLGSTMVQVGLSQPAPGLVLCKQLTLKYD